MEQTTPMILEAIKLNQRRVAVKEGRDKCFRQFNRIKDGKAKAALQEACALLTVYQFELEDKIEAIAESIDAAYCRK